MVIRSWSVGEIGRRTGETAMQRRFGDQVGFRTSVTAGRRESDAYGRVFIDTDRLAHRCERIEHRQHVDENAEPGEQLAVLGQADWKIDAHAIDSRLESVFLLNDDRAGSRGGVGPSSEVRAPLDLDVGEGIVFRLNGPSINEPQIGRTDGISVGIGDFL
jgi:hypothetical protein